MSCVVGHFPDPKSKERRVAIGLGLVRISQFEMNTFCNNSSCRWFGFKAESLKVETGLCEFQLVLT